MSTQRLIIDSLKKDFWLHTQNSAHITVFERFSLSVSKGECVAITGPSGMGKSTLLKCLYGNYKVTEGHINLCFDDGNIDLVNCSLQYIHALRRETIGYVSQFLRFIPRVPAIDIVMEPLLLQGAERMMAQEKSQDLLQRLNIPQQLWPLSPATFSGGEQQRINIARGFVADYPVLLLDEPTASLDTTNRGVVIELINEAKDRGSAIIGIFHDEQVRDQVADRLVDLTEFIL